MQRIRGCPDPEVAVKGKGFEHCIYPSPSEHTELEGSKAPHGQEPHVHRDGPPAGDREGEPARQPERVAPSGVEVPV